MKKTLYTIAVFTAVVLFFYADKSVANEMKPHHKEAGIACADCHGTGPKKPVPMETCRNCHEAYVPTGEFSSEPNPHNSPHYGPDLECENCHHEHEASELLCDNCHAFNLKAP
jgi:Zn finger protein HypA/HybF involved in hydrogenase expression